MTQHTVKQFKSGDLTFDDLESRISIRLDDDIVTGTLKSYSVYRTYADGLPIEDDSLPPLVGEGPDVEERTDVVAVNLFVGHRELISLELRPDDMIELLGANSYIVRH